MPRFILMIAWAANGTAFTMQEFDGRDACMNALAWVTTQADKRGGIRAAICVNKATGKP